MVDETCDLLLVLCFDHRIRFRGMRARPNETENAYRGTNIELDFANFGWMLKNKQIDDPASLSTKDQETRPELAEHRTRGG